MFWRRWNLTLRGFHRLLTGSARLKRDLGARGTRTGCSLTKLLADERFGWDLEVSLTTLRGRNGVAIVECGRLA